MVQQTKAKLLARVRRLKGQVEAVERALEGDVDHPGILMLLAAVRGAANGIAVEVLGDHIRQGIIEADAGEERAREADAVVDVVRTYLK